MRLEDITAELRPRSTWEAADLGTALVRRDFGAVMLRQAVVILPIWILLGVLLFRHPGWVIFFIWWLKPLSERISLFYLSRRLFGAKPTLGETIKAAPGLLFKSLLMTLVTTRFSPARSAIQPVNVLEGLRWGAFSRRVRVLGRYADGGRVTFVILILELGLVLGLAGLVAMLLPFSSSLDGMEMLGSVFRGELSEIPTSVFWQFAGLYAASVFLLSPFYAGSGFAIYINARTLLEGWDIELAFRRIGKRLSGENPQLEDEEGGVKRGKSAAAAVGILVLLGLFGAGTGPVAAAPDIEEEIAEVLEHPDFKIHKVEVRLPTSDKDDRGTDERRDRSGDSYDGGSSRSGASGAGGGFGAFVLYSAAIAGVGLLAWWLIANRRMFAAGSGGVEQKKVRTVMGMEVAAESLPPDVPSAASAAWEAGEKRMAVGLLYRGAICWLVESGNVDIRESDTEHECLERVAASPSDSRRREIFEEITGQWILLAYGNRPPDEQAFRKICTGWPFGLDPKQAAPAATKLQPALPS